MSGAPPLVSVVAACYNHAAYLAETLDSIAAQTYAPVELVIVDDASTDGSPDLIRAWAAGRRDVRLLLHERNTGVSRALNDALRAISGRYVAFVATDDTWLPDRLARQVPVLEAAPPEVGVVYGDADLVDEQGEPLGTRFIATYRDFETPPEGDLFAALVESNFIPGMTTLVRREVFDTVGVFDESLVYEDWDFWLRVARRYRFVYSPDVMVRYRVLATSLGRNLGPRALDSHLRLTRKHLDAGPPLDKVVRDRVVWLAGELARTTTGTERLRHLATLARYAGPRAALRAAR
jgi:glycosyltransferase involved in cell wall biosynthesis